MSNLNGNPSADSGLLGGTFSSTNLNTLKIDCVTTFFVYSLIHVDLPMFVVVVANVVPNVVNVMDL
jgi:hypothetical protein